MKLEKKSMKPKKVPPGSAKKRVPISGYVLIKILGDRNFQQIG
jgi:hypothetical protein